jgi:3',5'-cyclic AMP phosphodiesterase CpdA
MKFIHLTDPHLVAPGELLHRLDPQARLRAALESIASEHADAAFVVITGDLTDRGEPSAYAALRTELARLPMPVHLLAGNHDHREHLREAFPQAPADGDGHLQFAFSAAGHRFIALDTLEPGASWGRFCQRRADWLTAELARSAPEPVLLFMHHPPFAVGMAPMDAIALRDSGPLRAALAPHGGRIRHLFFGHLHRPLAGSWCGIPTSTLRGTNHQMALALDETRRYIVCHEPPQYAVVLLDPETVIVHFHDFADRSPRFGFDAEPVVDSAPDSAPDNAPDSPPTA